MGKNSTLKAEIALIDERSLLAQALNFAVHNREPDDTSSGEAQIKRAKRYLDFLRGNATLAKIIRQHRATF
jgi:hypothetical protein